MESENSNKDFRERTLRSLKQGLGRLWKRKSVTITEYDPSYKVVYLGNVLTGWAKGDGCVEKPLATLWKNYTSSSKPDVHMKVTVTQSGLKAVTKEHGLTEYWSHRVTYCASPSAYPKVFCWVYRHEGRKLKQELRCHAVLCSKESTARRMVTQLNTRLAQALIEFKRDKLSRQNARLSLANCVYDNPSLPRRKILLSTGSHNYRPPLERSKSAPKLMSIEESLEEEEDSELRKSMKKPYRGCHIEDELKRPRRLSYAGVSTLSKLESPSLKSLDEATVRRNLINATEERCDILLDEMEENKTTETEQVEEKPFANDDVSCFWIGGSSFSLHSSLEEEDDLTTDGEVDEDNSRLYSVSDEDIEIRSKISESECNSNDDEQSCKDVAIPESDKEEDYDRLGWESDKEGTDERVNGAESMDTDCESLESRTNSLVRDRKRMFEKQLYNDPGIFNDKFILKDEIKSGCLVQTRRMLFEAPLRNSTMSDITVLDLTRLGKGYLELEEDSTPSLQSISSGSDTSSTRMSDQRQGAKQNYDLDSLSEEDSDESGYVESVPQDGADDKERDLPHHQLMKSCILTTKTPCVQV